MELLRVEGLNKSYGKQQVLKDLNLTIESGKIYGLIGRNGAGKTTLLGIMTGQNTHNSGSVTYGGEQVWENATALGEICFSRELSATVMGGANTMKIKYYLDCGAIYYKNWDADYANRLVSHFKLDKKKKISQLSKGQMSLVTVIIALASRCPLTILDEPVAGLDVVAREDFYRLLLEEFTQSDRTFILSTHIIEEAAGVFDQVLFLNDGVITENASTDDLVAQFAYVSGHVDVVKEALSGLTVISTEHMGRQAMCVVRGDEAQLEALHGLDVTVSPMNLQKIFVALCGDHREGDAI